MCQFNHCTAPIPYPPHLPAPLPRGTKGRLRLELEDRYFHNSSLEAFKMALFISQLGRTTFSVFCRTRPSYLAHVRPPTSQKLQRQVFATVKFGEKLHSTSETGEKNHQETPRDTSRVVGRRIHVGNLLTGKDKYTNEDTLLEYFSQYGEVENLEFFRRKFTDLPRGFAFVTFRHVESARKVLADAESHVIDGQNATIALPMKTEKRVVRGKTDLTVVVSKVFKDTSKQAIEEHFSQFGKVERVILAQKDPSDENLSSYYVVFSSLHGAKKALEQPTHRISNQGIDSQVTEFTNAKNFTGKTKRVVLRPVPDHITVDDLRDYFQQFGEVELVELKIDHYDLPYPEKDLNIAFVHFTREDIVEEVAKNEDHLINGSEVKVLKHRNMHVVPERARKHWLSLEGLPMSTKRQDIREFFEKTYGLVPNDIFMRKHQVFNQKVVCIISFISQGEVEMVLRKSTLTFHGVPVYFRKLFWSKVTMH